MGFLPAHRLPLQLISNAYMFLEAIRRPPIPTTSSFEFKSLLKFLGWLMQYFVNSSIIISDNV